MLRHFDSEVVIGWPPCRTAPLCCRAQWSGRRRGARAPPGNPIQSNSIQSNSIIPLFITDPEFETCLAPSIWNAGCWDAKHISNPGCWRHFEKANHALVIQCCGCTRLHLQQADVIQCCGCTGLHLQQADDELVVAGAERTGWCWARWLPVPGVAQPEVLHGAAAHVAGDGGCCARVAQVLEDAALRAIPSTNA